MDFDLVDFPGTMVLKSPTGSEMGKSTASRSCVVNKYQPAMLSAKIIAPPPFTRRFIRRPNSETWSGDSYSLKFSGESEVSIRNLPISSCEKSKAHCVSSESAFGASGKKGAERV